MDRFCQGSRRCGRAGRARGNSVGTPVWWYPFTRSQRGASSSLCEQNESSQHDVCHTRNKGHTGRDHKKGWLQVIPCTARWIYLTRIAGRPNPEKAGFLVKTHTGSQEQMSPHLNKVSGSSFSTSTWQGTRARPRQPLCSTAKYSERKVAHKR